jgi:hypothetical protein
MKGNRRTTQNAPRAGKIIFGRANYAFAGIAIVPASTFSPKDAFNSFNKLPASFHAQTYIDKREYKPNVECCSREWRKGGVGSSGGSGGGGHRVSRWR